MNIFLSIGEQFHTIIVPTSAKVIIEKPFDNAFEKILGFVRERIF